MKKIVVLMMLAGVSGDALSQNYINEAIYRGRDICAEARRVTPSIPLSADGCEWLTERAGSGDRKEPFDLRNPYNAWAWLGGSYRSGEPVTAQQINAVTNALNLDEYKAWTGVGMTSVDRDFPFFRESGSVGIHAHNLIRTYQDQHERRDSRAVLLLISNAAFSPQPVVHTENGQRRMQPGDDLYDLVQRARENYGLPRF